MPARRACGQGAQLGAVLAELAQALLVLLRRLQQLQVPRLAGLLLAALVLVEEALLLLLEVAGRAALLLLQLGGLLVVGGVERLPLRFVANPRVKRLEWP